MISEESPDDSSGTARHLILAEGTHHYRSPATLRNRLLVAIWVSQAGRKSFVFEYRITDEVSGRPVV